MTTADQAKVKKAVARGAIDPADVPASARTLDLHDLPSSQSLKRAHSSMANPPSSSQPVPSSSQFSRSTGSNNQEVYAVDSDEEDVGAETPENSRHEELYCIMPANVVGIQYYRGACRLFNLSSFVANSEQALSVLARKFALNENRTTHLTGSFPNWTPSNPI